MNPSVIRRAGRWQGGWLAAICASLLLFMSLSGADASTRTQLQSARGRLHALEARIASQRTELDRLRAQAQAAADRAAAAQAQLADTRGRQEITKTELSRAEHRLEGLQERLDARARTLFMNGPQNMIGVVLNSNSLGEFEDRVEFAGAAYQADADLANHVENAATLLEQKERLLRSLEQRQLSAVQELQRQEAAVAQQLKEQQALYSGLASDRADLVGLVGDLSHKLSFEQRQAAAAAAASAETTRSSAGGGPGPFQTCPVNGPVAYSDDFGAPRYSGGYHTHQGNDMFAPYGTPIVAPFSGTASNSTNGLGGLAVTVSGAGGFVYNAHMSRIGQLGSVSTGDVIGYVGDSGDAQGTSPHDHFEWHPGGGAAVDPFPYLNQVC